MKGHIDFAELSSAIMGDVYEDEYRLTLLSTDAGIHRVKPVCVVYPKNTKDVVQTVKFATANSLSVHPRGTGSGLCGSAIGSGIVIDFSKYMNKLINLDINNLSFECEPGYKYGELEVLLKGSGVFFPPAPSSGEYASFGGMYATNAGGAYSVKYGNVADYLIDAEYVSFDGTVYNFEDISSTPVDKLPQQLKELYNVVNTNNKVIIDDYPPVPTNVCGYELRYVTDNNKLNLHRLIGGAEGTLGIVTSLKFRLAPKAKHDTLIVAYFDNITSSAKAAQLAIKRNPAGIEIMDKSLLNIARENDPKLAKLIPDGYDNVLMIEFESNSLDEVTAITESCTSEIKAEGLSPLISLAVSETDKAQFWAVRKAAVPILYLLKGSKKIIPLVEDAAVPANMLVEYFEGLYSIFNKHNVQFVLYGHIAKGLIHSRPLLDLRDGADIDLLTPIADDVFELVMKLKGTISGEHGDGRVRSIYIPRQYKHVYEFFVYTKQLLDPHSMFNPDIIIQQNPVPIEENLRYGNDYHTTEPENKLLIWENGMTVEIEKCHGCSKCTTVTTATRMCPMYKHSRDEASAPKAKANILRALISGKIDDEAIYTKAFQSVMDRCVNCGSCTRECPSKVNIPKLALEAKSKYVEKFGTSLENKLVTKFELFGRYTRFFFPLITPLMKFKPMRKIAELTAGMSAERKFIKFKVKSLFDRFPDSVGSGQKKVLYFAGCSSAYMRPEIGESTIKLLEKMGYTVLIPEQNCCGVPHVAKGMAEGAVDKIEENIRNWGAMVTEVDHIVVSCSSCGLSLTKEWKYYVGGEVTEKIKEKTVHISTLINKHFNNMKLKDGLTVAYHSPCHMKQMPDPEASLNMLKGIDGVKAEPLANSCCGMAGSWGISAKHYEESVMIAKPMADSLAKSSAGICLTDCPTCEMQLKHLSDRTIMHPAEFAYKIIKGTDSSAEEK